MGGCRCSYRNCSLRTDGKTHMFHYPVFDKLRCHQWLTNAHKLEFLNLKVSQLKNRVVCQHHFKDENFMNFKKDKLTFDAVPTEDGPYCDSSQIDEAKTEQDDPKVFSISLDDIENDYLTIVDKKANFSVKYGDFLTNCDLMELDSLNSLAQINDNNQITIKGLCQLDSSPNIPKDVRKVRRSQRRGKYKKKSSKSILNDSNNRENKIIENNSVINHINTINASKESETRQTEEDHNSTSNLIINVSLVPIEFDEKQLNDENQQNVYQPIELKVFDEPKLNDQNEVNIYQPTEVQAFDKTNDQNQGNIYQTIEVQAFDEKKSNNQQQLNTYQPIEVQAYDETKSNSHNLQNMYQSTELKGLDKSKPINRNYNRSLLNENKKIRIISEKSIVPGVGKLEPISPTRVLTFPNKTKSFNTNLIAEIPALPKNKSVEIKSNMTHCSKDNMAIKQHKSELQKLISPQQDKASILNTQSEVLNKSPNGATHNTSIIKNKIPPERVAAIAEKRKFNMKLRDIIEDCLDKLDENDKSDYHNRKLAHKKRILESKKGQVSSYLAKDPQLPGVQDYTIAYLEARMKKMENNLLNKIEENSQKIGALKQTYAPVVNKKSVHTQTSVSEDVHKKQLYQEISKYLSKEANSLIYEELFINKYIKDMPKVSAKRRKCR